MEGGALLRFTYHHPWFPFMPRNIRLPDDILELILVKYIDDLADRVRFTSTCRTLRKVGKDTPRLWEVVRLDKPVKAGLLAAWLASHRGLLKVVDLRGMQGWKCQSLLGALAGGSVEELALNWPFSLLDTDVIFLPDLCKLSVDNDDECSVSDLQGNFSRLSHLTSLSLTGFAIPSLDLTGLTALKELCVSGDFQESCVNLSFDLSPVTQLTSLAFENFQFELLEPGALSHLRLLRSLSFIDCSLLGAEDEDDLDWEDLGWEDLLQLTSLVLTGCNMPELPEAVRELPCLQVLDFSTRYMA